MNDMRQRLLEMERKNLIGKLITLIQLLVSVICIVTVAGSGMLPKKYLIFLIGALAVLFGATHILQYPKNKVLRYTGMIISLLMTIILAVISMGMMKTDDVLKKVGGATYKTDNMVVVVKKGDSAKSIEDAEDYRFGYQTAVDQKNTDKMFNEIESEVGKDVKSEEYSSLTDEAQALLDGKVDAAVFNEGYMSMIDESIDGFSEKVKILYQYGVKTKVKRTDGRSRKILCYRSISATVFYARSEMGAADPVGLCSGNGSYDLWNTRRRHFNRKIQRTQGIWCG